MVFQKPCKFRLVSEIGFQVIANPDKVAIFQTVVKPFVVTVIEAFFLQFPFHIPVDFGQEFKARVASLDRADRRSPKLLHRPSPGAFEDPWSQ